MRIRKLSLLIKENIKDRVADLFIFFILATTLKRGIIFSSIPSFKLNSISLGCPDSHKLFY